MSDDVEIVYSSGDGKESVPLAYETDELDGEPLGMKVWVAQCNWGCRPGHIALECEDHSPQS